VKEKQHYRKEMFHPTTERIDSLTIDDVAGQAVPESETGRTYNLYTFEASCIYLLGGGPQRKPSCFYRNGVNRIQILKEFCFIFLPSDGTHSAELPWQVVCPSVYPSVTLRYRGRIGWNSWNIISRLISLT